MILFADADGASKFSDVDKLETAIKKNAKKEIEVRINLKESLFFKIKK